MNLQYTCPFHGHPLGVVKYYSPFSQLFSYIMELMENIQCKGHDSPHVLFFLLKWVNRPLAPCLLCLLPPLALIVIP